MTLPLKEIKTLLNERVKTPLVFSVLSGSHLYGFNSEDSDYDIRGCHILSVPDVLGIVEPSPTINNNNSDLEINGRPLDYEFHDLKKFCHLLCKHNANQIEQLYSPLVIHTSPEHRSLKEIARGCFTSTMFYHFTNFARNEWKDFINGKKQVKKLLYLYRLMMCGIHLMDTGVLISDIYKLNDIFHLTFIDELVKMKMSGKETAELHKPDMVFHEGTYASLLNKFEHSMKNSRLPQKVPEKTQDELNEFVKTVRMKCSI